MTPELQGVLSRKYPKVFRNLGGDMTKTCMAWGICCGDGWFLILWRLCAVLEPLGVVASQIKEKFGTLRFYWYTDHDESHWDKIKAAVRKAESESARTCEQCGRPGREVNRGGWLSTMCMECRL